MGRLNSLAYFLQRRALFFTILFFGAFAFGQAYYDQMNIDNLRLDGNTLSTTNTDGDFTIDLNGTGSTILNDLTATTVPYLDASKKITSSAVTPTELGYVSGVTSAIQTQFNAVMTDSSTSVLTNKSIDSDNNTITNIVNADIKAAAAIDLNKLAAVTASRAVVSDGSGFVSSATTTSTEIGYVNGVTSAIQTQLDAKTTSTLTDTYLFVGNGSNVATGVTVSGDIGMANDGTTSIGSGVILDADVNASAAIALSKLAAGTANRVPLFDGSGFLTSSSVTNTVLGYLDLTSSGQTQLDAKQTTTLADGTMLVGNGSNVATAVTMSGDVVITNAGVTSFGSGVILNADVNASAAIDATKIADGSVTNTEFQYINTVSSNVQDQITALTAPSLVVEAKTIDFTAVTGKQYLIDMTNGDITATLTTSVGESGKSIEFIITEASTFTLIIDGDSAETINDLATLELREDDESATLRSDNSDWNVTSLILNEYVEAQINASTSTSVADTLTAITGSAIVLRPGTWNICYAISMYIDPVSSGTGMGGTIGIYDASNTRVDSSLTYAAHQFSSAIGSTFPMSHCAEEIVTTTDTYDLGMRCEVSAATGYCTFPSESLGPLTNPDNEPKIWARRTK